MKYKNPPVVETVLSVQFNPLRNFGAGQLGAYWTQLGSDWPYVVDAPTVEQVFERFEPATVWEQTAFVKFSSKIDVRLQIRNRAKDRMIQVQNGRFFYNWLKAPDSEYPSYDSVRPAFDEHWEKFREFVIAHSEEDSVQPNQWEILYVNHIPRGTVWNELTDVPQVLTFLRQPDFDGMNVCSDGIGGEWRFEIRPKRGRLFVRIGTKMKKEDESPCVVMTLMARGPVEAGVTSLDEGLELGHKTITDAFDRLTSTSAHKFWEVQNANM